MSDGPAHEDDFLVEIWVEGWIKLWESDIEDVHGDLSRAVQRELGHTGFLVDSAEV